METQSHSYEVEVGRFRIDAYRTVNGPTVHVEAQSPFMNLLTPAEAREFAAKLIQAADFLDEQRRKKA